MLDAFIIDKIQKERQVSATEGLPLRIGIPSPELEEWAPEPDREDKRERGIVDIDDDVVGIATID